jgi:hypothetical protein
VELNHFVQGVVTDDVCIKHEEEPRWVIGKQDILSEPDRASSSQRFRLQRACDFDSILDLVISYLDLPPSHTA